MIKQGKLNTLLACNIFMHPMTHDAHYSICKHLGMTSIMIWYFKHVLKILPSNVNILIIILDMNLINMDNYPLITCP